MRLYPLDRYNSLWERTKHYGDAFSIGTFTSAFLPSKISASPHGQKLCENPLKLAEKTCIIPHCFSKAKVPHAGTMKKRQHFSASLST